jgi:phospholipase/lecithinase/hemolysin
MTFLSARAVAFAKPWLFSFVLIVGLLAPGLASADGRPFDRIVVFGDSLSDSGNLYALNGGVTATPENNYGMGMDEPMELITLIPKAPYSSHRLSNGLTWVELLGTALGRGRNVKPAFGSKDRQALNFAVAGATASNPEGLPNQHPLLLGGQVAAFLARADAKIGTTSDTLYVIAIGGNDVRATVELQTDFLTDALGSIDKSIKALYAAGAKKFLIWNIPDVGTTPAFQRLQNGVPELGFGGIPNLADDTTNLILWYNSVLKNHLQSLPTAPEDLGGLPGIEIIYFDAFEELREVQRDGPQYGLTNVQHACIQPLPFATTPERRCAEPDRYLFWDGIHPTRVTHAIIAFLVGKTLVEALQD